MAEKFINTEKLVTAFRQSQCADLLKDLAELYARGIRAEERMDKYAAPSPFTREQDLICALTGNDKEVLLSCARQLVGVISKAQRATGCKIFTQYIATDEEKIEILHELDEFVTESLNAQDEEGVA